MSELLQYINKNKLLITILKNLKPDNFSNLVNWLMIMLLPEK